MHRKDSERFLSKHLHIACLQLRPASNLEESIETGLHACETAGELGADVIVFPEMWSNGYSSALDSSGQRHFNGPAQTIDGEYLKAFRETARHLKVAIAITFFETSRGTLRNSAALIDRDGEIQLHYAKVHTCGFDEPERFLTPGSDLPVCELSTPAGSVTVGMLICFDREFPESARALARQGAELILIPNSCELEQHRLAQLDSRAFENMAAIALANYAAPKNNGQSLVLDGMAFDESGASRDMALFRGDHLERILIADLDLIALRKYRSEDPGVNLGAARSSTQTHTKELIDEISLPDVTRRHLAGVLFMGASAIPGAQQGQGHRNRRPPHRQRRTRQASSLAHAR